MGMEEWLFKKWDFLCQNRDALIVKAIAKMGRQAKKHLVFCGGTSLHLYSTRLIFNDEPIRASEDIDIFNKNSKLLENPEGVSEEALAQEYSGILRQFGFENEQRNSIVLISPHKIKAEFFYDAASYPAKAYLHNGLAIIHPEALYRIKIKLLALRENVSERDLVDVLYLSTKYPLPSKIAVREDVGALLEWKVLENYLTEYGEAYFKGKGFEGIAREFSRRVEIHEED